MAEPKDDPEYDVYCDPNHPVKITYEDILAASLRISGFINRTQCPERGVRNALMMLTDSQKKFGVTCASCGNHGIAINYSASQLGIPSIVVMPTVASGSKRNDAEKYGGQVILYGKDLAQAQRHAMILAKQNKMTYINGFDHPNVIEGQGTVGIEILFEVPDVDAILIPCGGGSLLTGVAIAVKHLKPNTEIYGIETEKTCSMTEALKKNQRVFLPTDSSIADELCISKVGVNTFYNIKGLVKKMVVVTEDWVARAMMHVIEEEKFNIEGAGAVGIAALMSGLFPNLRGKKVVVIISGGNINPTILARTLHRGMAAEGRLVKFKVTVQDRPGGLAELVKSLAGLGIMVRDCVPQRSCTEGDLLNVQIQIIAETRGWDHTKQMVQLIKKNYKEYLFQDIQGKTPKPAIKKRVPCLAPHPVCLQ